MLIIIDGPDCCSKSTLARQLIDTIKTANPDDNVELLHKGPPIKHALIEYVGPLLSYMQDNAHHIICDRWHIGERVYPHILGRETSMTDDLFHWIEEFLISRGALLIQCRASISYLTACAQSRGDDQLFIDQIADTNEEFSRAFAESIVPRVSVFADFTHSRLLGHIYAKAYLAEDTALGRQTYIKYDREAYFTKLATVLARS